MSTSLKGKRIRSQCFEEAERSSLNLQSKRQRMEEAIEEEDFLLTGDSSPKSADTDSREDPKPLKVTHEP